MPNKINAHVQRLNRYLPFSPDHDQIYEAAIQLWKVNRIKINCIGIGVRLRFLSKLCTKTGGKAKFFT